MKKNIINIVVVVLVLIALPVSYFIGYNSFKQSSTVKNDSEVQHKAKYVSRDSVKETVLNHANVSETDTRELSVELDIEHNKVIYEVSFEVGDYDYEYEVDAVTGVIVSDYKELDKVITTTKKVTTTTTKKKTTTKKTTSGTISKSKAKSIALKDAGVSESKIRDYEIELDYERGKNIYEIDFEAGGKDYSYDIDAKSGKIIHKEVERDN